MPRPGPRPYECVRRAWHSDRHRPIRGSLIQEIFRVVNEVHSSSTRKNKEWQEKLPVVVLKAEEIMYSKANSEAEYMDLETLWDRTNDAINTIIRLDESTETGDLLPPCIEAALNLGCTPRRASRSQRNSSPRDYLTPSTHEPNSFSPGIVHTGVHANHTMGSQCLPNCLNFIKPSFMNLTCPGSESQNRVCHNSKVASDKFSCESDEVPPYNNNRCLSIENYPASNVCSVYPLYYGSCLEPQHGYGIFSNSAPTAMEPVNLGVVQNLVSCNETSLAKITQTDLKDGLVNPNEIGCDLSLRLGSRADPLLSVENRNIFYANDVGCRCSRARSKFNDRMPQKDKKLLLSTRVNLDETLDLSCPIKSSENVDEDVAIKKRKAVLDQPVAYQQLSWQPKLPFHPLTSRMESAGL